MIHKSLFAVLFLLPSISFCQKGIDKTDASAVAKLKADIEYLASDNLQGRLTGAQGEMLAADYIERRFKEIKIEPFKSAHYQWEFTFNDGKKVGSNAYFKIFDTKLNIGTEVIPMPYGQEDGFRGSALPNVDEQQNVWFVSMKDAGLGATNLPFKVLYQKAKDCIKDGATAVVFFNDLDSSRDINLIGHPKYEMLTAPVVVVNNKAYQKTLKPNLKKDWIYVDAKLGYEDANITGRNVIATINNNAPMTIVLSADYDHLGKIGDAIYNGANNNASGVASLLALAEMIKSANLKNYNYLFLVFSGSEFKNQGASHFLQENNKLTSSFSCLINLNMLGRQKPSKELYINGVGTSSIWGSLLLKYNKGFSLKVDSAGMGYGAYSLFYKKNIPLLSFSTGYCKDYSKPDDDAGKINYTAQAEIDNYIFKLISDLDKLSKPDFKETYNIAEKLANLKSDIGIIPDYSFTEDGIRVATCLANRLADKAGLEAEDVITQIAEFSIIDFDDYIAAMNKLEKGREVPVTVKRGKNEFKFFVVL